MRRGEVWWAELPEPAGRRPVVLLTRNSVLAVRESITVAQVTSRVRGIRSEVRLGPADGLRRPCVVNLDVIQTIPRARLLAPITSLTSARMQEIEDAIHYALELVT